MRRLIAALALAIAGTTAITASALAGGMFLMTADTFARSVFAPSELPVGIMTALAGGPFFIYLLMWRKDRLS